MESALLSFGHGFKTLDHTEALIDLRRDNSRALVVYQRFGMTEIVMNGRNLYSTCQHCRFLNRRRAHLAVLRKAKEIVA